MLYDFEHAGSRPKDLNLGFPVCRERYLGDFASMDESMTNNVSAGNQYHAREQATESGLPVIAALTIVGFACYWACVFILLFSATYAPSTESPMDGFLVRFAMLLGFAALHPFSATNYSNAFLRMRFRLTAQIIVCLLVILLGILSVLYWQIGLLALPAQLLIWLIIGMGAGQVLVIWGFVFNGIDVDRTDNSFCMLCIAGAIICAALICTFMLFAPSAPSVFATSVLWVTSMVLQSICLKRLPHITDESKSDSVQARLLRREMIPPVAICIVLGIILAHNGLILGVGRAFPVALCGIAAGSLTQIILTRAFKHPTAISSIERFAFPVLGTCLLAILILQPGVAFAVITALGIAVATIFLLAHWDTLVIFAYRKHLQPAFHFGQGLIATTAGAAIGWGLVAVPLMLSGSDYATYTITGWSEQAVPTAISGFSGMSISAFSCLVGIVVCLVAPAAFPHTERSEFMQLVSYGIPAAPDLTTPTWNDTCDEISKRFNLTPRERECFAYLAKGRNAEHISKELVISLHTAKTHISRIYRKMGVNSQQQLIDAVERETK